MSTVQIDYVDCITRHFPNIIVECIGSLPNIYENITLVSGAEQLPSQAVLDDFFMQDFKLNKIIELSNECEQHIIGGFESNALGSPHIYDSEQVDQLNLVGTTSCIAPIEGVREASVSPYACRPVIDGVIQAKTYVVHTYVQLRQVIDDGAAFKLSKLMKFNQLRDYINTTTLTFDGIIAITMDFVIPPY